MPRWRCIKYKHDSGRNEIYIPRNASALLSSCPFHCSLSPNRKRVGLIMCLARIIWNSDSFVMHMCVEMRLLRSCNTSWASETKSAFNINDSLTWDQKEWLVNVCTVAQRILLTIMGVESGGTGGRVPRSRKISGGRPPRNYDISVSFFLIGAIANFAFSNIFEIKWPKSEEKLNFGGR